jgi:two-component system, NarL family, nitrate/nitrite response regulator NarL
MRTPASFIARGGDFDEAGLVALRCLLVDDNMAFLASASRLLDAQGIEVVGLASSGSEAIRLAAAHEPDVVLVDVQLGAEDGLALTRRLVDGDRALRVILISTHSEDDLGDLVCESAAVGFLPKSALSAEAISELLA